MLDDDFYTYGNQHQATHNTRLIAQARADAVAEIYAHGREQQRNDAYGSYRTPNIYVLQAVLQVLSDAYSSMTPPTHTGTLDEATVISIQTFQELSGLPQTGEVDKMTWKQLALHFPLAANNRRFTER